MTGELALTESAAAEALEISLRSGAVNYEFIFRAELALPQDEAGGLKDAQIHLTRCRAALAEGEDRRGVGGRLSLAE